MKVDLESLLLSEDASIRQALETIERGGVEIALVVAQNRRLIGTLTDGDLRRALLNDAKLSDPASKFVSRAPVTAPHESGRAEVLDLMKARSLEQIPIVDEAGRVVGLHLIQDLIGGAERANWAVIMAGGRGTRLGPLTEAVPKPMILVAGRPIIERIILHLVGGGIRRIFVAVGYMSDAIEARLGDGSDYGCEIQYLREDPNRPLGTGGSLSLLRRDHGTPENPLIVMNGDLIVQFSVQDLLEFHQASGSVMTISSRPFAYEVPFGVIEIDDAGRLVRINEKPLETWKVNSGVYVLDPSLLSRVPEDREFLITSLMEDCLEQGETVSVWEMEGDWIDVGRPVDLHRARGDV